MFLENGLSAKRGNCIKRMRGNVFQLTTDKSTHTEPFSCPGEFHHPAHHSIFNAKCLCKKKCGPDCRQQGNEGPLSMRLVLKAPNVVWEILRTWRISNIINKMLFSIKWCSLPILSNYVNIFHSHAMFKIFTNTLRLRLCLLNFKLQQFIPYWLHTCLPSIQMLYSMIFLFDTPEPETIQMTISRVSSFPSLRVVTITRNCTQLCLLRDHCKLTIVIFPNSSVANQEVIFISNRVNFRKFYLFKEFELTVMVYLHKKVILHSHLIKILLYYH